MNEPYRIRLRGGWNLVADGAEVPWSLPCTGAALVEAGANVRLIRKFNHPPVRTKGQVCRLVIRRVAGVSEVEVDGQKFAPAMPVVDHPEAGFDFELPESPGHLIILTIETAAAAEASEWGHICLEIEED